jgi:plastocyanin
MNTRTALVGGVLIIVAIGLLIVLSNDSNDSSTNDTGNASSGKEAVEKAPTVVVGKDGKPVGGVADLTYKAGDEVRFKVESAVADEIHVHGYDLMKDVEAGGTVTFEFPADLEGVFEAELEGRGEEIVELTVEP